MGMPIADVMTTDYSRSIVLRYGSATPGVLQDCNIIIQYIEVWTFSVFDSCIVLASIL
jgi:hypothetical protein